MLSRYYISANDVEHRNSKYGVVFQAVELQSQGLVFCACVREKPNINKPYQASLYETVIDEVIANSRDAFENSGIDEATLQDLRKIWRDKLSASNVAKFSWSTIDKINYDDDYYNFELELDLGDSTIDGSSNNNINKNKNKNKQKNKNKNKKTNNLIRQVDGPLDDDDIDELSDSDDPLNSSDDDEGNRSEEDSDDETDQNNILCLYDKVQRVRNKWKCTLKDGIASIDGKDYAFMKCTGEADW
ncbi:transcription initiation factor IIA large subunit [Ascoidea rubescens DSM 1968]|uniref:Transcription initiation factor IIA large subunit n=1 Tax=Ascoidea rubescens DSM 1968 TaxID=1344418 RepID=A0A1D2VQY3_9ASCO|nr:TFIIA-domain-containing protein [Ascoidea rubescens DSM 1968]ODV64014.1 TFIIA-domain-containing protein [Ascoidea rubescens DSM 1968]